MSIKKIVPEVLKGHNGAVKGLCGTTVADDGVLAVLVMSEHLSGGHYGVSMVCSHLLWSVHGTLWAPIGCLQGISKAGGSVQDLLQSMGLYGASRDCSALVWDILKRKKKLM